MPKHKRATYHQSNKITTTHEQMTNATCCVCLCGVLVGACRLRQSQQQTPKTHKASWTRLSDTTIHTCFQHQLYTTNIKQNHFTFIHISEYTKEFHTSQATFHISRYSLTRLPIYLYP